MSTSVLKALPGKLDIKRHSPSILYFYQIWREIDEWQHFQIVEINMKHLLYNQNEKPVLSGHSKRRSKIGFQNQLSLNAGQSIAEYSLGAFCNILDLH